MLRKILLIGLPLLVALGTATTVMFYDGQRTPGWQQTLEQYLAQSGASSVNAADDQIIASDAAQVPWNFDAEMGHAVVDAQAWQWSIEQLPYPPDALFCVLVDDSTPTSTSSVTQPTNPPTQRLVYVAHHTDKLWRVGWVVHEGGRAPFAVADTDALGAVGCDLEPLAGGTR